MGFAPQGFSAASRGMTEFEDEEDFDDEYGDSNYYDDEMGESGDSELIRQQYRQ